MELERLRHWSQILLWVSVLLPVLGGLAAAARFCVDRRVGAIAAARQADEQLSLRRELGAAQNQVAWLEQAATPRTLTSEPSRNLREALQACVDSTVHVRCATVAGDHEAHECAEAWAAIFRLAGWQTEGPGNTFAFSPFAGVRICVHNADTPPSCAGSVQQAFQNIGLPLEGQLDSSLNATMFQILVGNKPR
jgi:hypothetical protein